MLVKFFSVLALCASSALASVESPTLTTRFNPSAEQLLQSRYRPISQEAARGLTNAKRLAIGLPPMPPRKRSDTTPWKPKPSSSPGGPTCADGYLEVRDGQNKHVAYVAKTVNSFGEYEITQDQNDRLVVSIDLNDAAKSNGPDSNLPFFGGITGYDSDCNCSDLKHNSRNYAYLGATVQTRPLAPPSIGANSFTAATKLSRKIESAIFKYDPLTHRITPQWINEDGGSPATYVGLTQGSLILAGDQSSFVKAHGSTNWVTLHLVTL